MILNKYKNFIVFNFFVIFLLCGLFIYKDYGISWDEPIQRRYGRDVYNYVFEDNEKLLKNKDRYYGPVVEFILFSSEKVLKPDTLKQTYELRHLISFLIFFQGVVFFYLLSKDIFKDWRLGLLGSMFLIVSPRIFAHSFYNSKDMPFMAIFITTIYFILKFVKNPTKKGAVIAGLISAILISTRIMGLLAPAFIILGLVALRLFNNKKKIVLPLLISLLTCVVSVYLLWPILWNKPIDNFRKAFVQMSKYPQKTSMFYYGEKVTSTDIPWYYVFGFLIATTPVIYTILFCFGISFILINLIKAKGDIKQLIILGWFFIPLATVIYFKSTLYDSWRQMFFIYPSFLLLSLYGVSNLYKQESRVIKYTLSMLLIIGLASPLIFMIKQHPFQNVYFSMFAGRKENIEKRWELDYWGLSYKQALEYLDRTVDKEKIYVFAQNYPGENNINMVDPDKFEFASGLTKADYYLTNYRGTTNKTFKNYPEIYNIKVNGYKIMGIYKIK